MKKLLSQIPVTMAFPKPVFAVLRRSIFSSAAKPPNGLPNLNQIRKRKRARVIREAQSALIDYLHGTRSVPFAFAELIATNSYFSLCNLVRHLPFTLLTFSNAFQRLLRYQPLDEFEFFFESIGIDYDSIHRFLPPNKFFFSEEMAVLDSARALYGFGFPWNRLGMLYKEEVLIFGMCSDELMGRLQGLKERYGFGNLAIVGACLAFPQLLRADPGAGFDPVFRDLKRVFGGFDMEPPCVEGNVDAWYELCCKVRIFYDFGCEKGAVGEFMCEGKDVLLRCPREVLVRKVEYFSAFDVGKDEAVLLLLRRPEILSLDWENSTALVSVLRLLRHFGLDENELQCVATKYPYVVGRNEMANLPYVMRALDLNLWFFNEVKSSNMQLLASCALSCRDEDVDKEFADGLKRLECYRPAYIKGKVDSIKRIGFGENACTVKLIYQWHGSGEELKQRFEFLVRQGIEYSKLCSLLIKAPNVISQCPQILEKKLKFICEEMGCSIDYLYTFPGILGFNLTRLKYRYQFYLWLKESGLCKIDYSISSIVATGEKSFIKRLSRMNPILPKQYLERFSNKKFSDD